MMFLEVAYHRPFLPTSINYKMFEQGSTVSAQAVVSERTLTTTLFRSSVTESIIYVKNCEIHAYPGGMKDLVITPGIMIIICEV